MISLITDCDLFFVEEETYRKIFCDWVDYIYSLYNKELSDEQIRYLKTSCIEFPTEVYFRLTSHYVCGDFKMAFDEAVKNVNWFPFSDSEQFSELFREKPIGFATFLENALGDADKEINIGSPTFDEDCVYNKFKEARNEKRKELAWKYYFDMKSDTKNYSAFMKKYGRICGSDEKIDSDYIYDHFDGNTYKILINDFYNWTNEKGRK